MNAKLPLLLVGLTAVCNAALATEFGTVVSSTPVTATVASPQQTCTEQQAIVQPPTSGAGALVGALVGGVVGHSLGGGAGQVAATGLGVVAGSLIGDRAEAQSTPAQAVPVRSCQNAVGYQTQVVGYDVVYDYNGQRYTARLPQDPGPRVALNVTAAGAVTPQPVAATYTVAPTASYSVAVDTPYVVNAPYVYGPGWYGPGPYYYGGPSLFIGARMGFGGGHFRRMR